MKYKGLSTIFLPMHDVTLHENLFNRPSSHLAVNNREEDLSMMCEDTIEC